MQSKINLENWTNSRFISGDYQVGIFLGADPESLAHNCYVYSVSVIKNEHDEIFEQSFSSLSEAISFVNNRYTDWTFLDQSLPKAEGCGSCAAH